jgi:hypothetical protein
MEPRDREWIRAGLKASILTLAIIEARFKRTTFLDAAESARARRALDDDRAWLDGRKRQLKQAFRQDLADSSARTRSGSGTDVY